MITALMRNRNSPPQSPDTEQPTRDTEQPTRASNENQLPLNVGIAPHALRGYSLVRAPVLRSLLTPATCVYALQTVSSPLPLTLDAFIASCHNVHRYHVRCSIAWRATSTTSSKRLPPHGVAVRM